MQALHHKLDVVLVQILPYNCSETDYRFCQDSPPQQDSALYRTRVSPSDLFSPHYFWLRRPCLPGTCAKYCDGYVCTVCVCLSCLPARITRKPHGRISPNFAPCCSFRHSRLHSDRPPSIDLLFIGFPNKPYTNPRWRTVTILKMKNLPFQISLKSRTKNTEIGNKTANINIKTTVQSQC